ncbi:MAG: beta-ketoacyl synthase chain length factor [Motiliproteus sp.]
MRHTALGKGALKQIPPMIRRRFSALGKVAVSAALPILSNCQSIPSVFASRHGDAALTLSLLNDIAKDEPMSPTGFSLAVHNAVSGLFSIARKDFSEITSIAAMEGLVLQALLEAVAQLQDRERILCVIYDVPLPEFYDCDSDPFPYAIALVISHTEGLPFTLEQDCSADEGSLLPAPFDTEPLQFIGLLAGCYSELNTKLNGVSWRIKRVGQ